MKFAIVAILITLSGSVFAAEPIIQNVSLEVSGTWVEATWQTIGPGDSVLTIGSQTVRDSHQSLIHKVRVSGLESQTPYPVHITSSDGTTMFQYRSRVMTGRANEKLIKDHGQSLITVIENQYGPIDEESISPQIKRLIELNEKVGLLTQKRKLQEEKNKLEKSITANQRLLDYLDGNNPAAEMPPEIEQEVRYLIDVMPDLSEADIAALLRLKIGERIERNRIAEQQNEEQQNALRSQLGKVSQ